ncbi:hypothetical protein DL89DRAFT_289878 [Linderina pennispora]|uniref:G-protein coupled receptors family 1 profile domain-containing protein n=1 Tax=Linderina pennispora TaxID=61395 RepID=A0A1Y1WL30_9FUNG|nr:uncharacterized protein DL89DRAFT_289878 [Linderina pennispora]ORX74281.1 hypothetical protein DL89DRAFT_289878 [Linderina pennispora]
MPKLHTRRLPYHIATNAEKAIFYVTLGIDLINVFLIAFAIIHRSYLPIKCKQVFLTSGIAIGSMVFSVSFSLADGMVGFYGIGRHCFFWVGWMLTCCGLGIFLSFMNMRLVVYYRVFITRKTYRSKRCDLRLFVLHWWPLVVFWLPAFIIVTIGQLLPETQTARIVIADDGTLAYKYNYPYLSAAYTYFAVMIIIAWAMYFRMRSVAKAFNEFRMAVWTLSLFTLLLVLNIGIMVPNGMSQLWGRVMLAFCNTILLNSYTWLILGKPIFGHMFRRKEMLRDHLETMYTDGIVAQQAHMRNLHKQLYGVEDSSMALDRTSQEQQAYSRHLDLSSD